MTNKSFFLVLFVVFSSCSNNSKLDDKLIGFWSIDMDSVSTIDNYWHNNIGSNILSIKENKTCQLPYFIYLKHEYSEHIKWDTSSEGGLNYINFYAPNHPMNGKFMITLYKDNKEKLFKMRLMNGNTILVCRKGMENFDQNKNIDW